MAKNSMAKDSMGAGARRFTVKTAKVVASSCQ
jgi:hypothetical protein